jgi:hypothetical protein
MTLERNLTRDTQKKIVIMSHFFKILSFLWRVHGELQNTLNIEIFQIPNRDPSLTSLLVYQRALRNVLTSRGAWMWFGLTSLLVSSMALRKAIMSRDAQMWFGDVWTYGARVTEYWTFFIESSIKSKQNCLGKLGQLLGKS